MPYYVRHLESILKEAGIPNIKAYRARLDQYVQEILGTHELDDEKVWAILQPRLRDVSWRAQFVAQLRDKWENRDWRQEGL